MIAVIIAGGSGTRLWPLSTPSYPKHLLQVGSHEKSLLQQTYERISPIADDVYVVTEQSHDHHVRDQIPGLPEDRCIVEPGRRGTASCTLLALAQIAKNHDPGEPIIILWADHYIRDVDGFAHSVRLAAAAAVHEKKVVLIGVEPSYPATGFGYIKKSTLLNNEDFIFKVDSFKEKPDRETAESYLRNGSYLWNSGYFIATLTTFITEMTQSAPEMYKNYQSLAGLESDTLVERYLMLPSSNIDNALIEKVSELLVVPATFDWMDLGSYGDLHKASGSDEAGNFVAGEKVLLQAVENSYIESHDDKPVAVIGLDNIVVINTKDGILVARKDLSQAVGEISKRLQASTPE